MTRMTLLGAGPLRRGVLLGLACVFVLLPAIPSAAGIGIAPSSVELKPGVPVDTVVSVVNAEGLSARFSARLDGELAQYMNLSPARFELAPDVPEYGIRVQAHVPPTLPSGPHMGRLVVTQLPPEGGLGGSLTAGVVLIAVFEAFIPYEGDHADGFLYVRAPGAKREAAIALTIRNRGTTDLDVETTIEVYDHLSRLLDTLRPAPVHVPTGAFGLQEAPWAPSDAGPFATRAVVRYAGKSFTLAQAFETGTPSLELRAINASAFQLGKLARLTLTVQSLWSAPLDGVGAALTFAKDGETVSTASTNTLALDPLAEGRLDAYWDTAGLAPGDYVMAANFTVRERSQTVTKRLRVEQDRLIFEPFPAQPAPLFRPLPALLLLLALALLLALFLIFRRKRPKGLPPRQGPPPHHDVPRGDARPHRVPRALPAVQ